jgi:hypothetical protein
MVTRWSRLKAGIAKNPEPTRDSNPGPLHNEWFEEIVLWTLSVTG